MRFTALAIILLLAGPLPVTAQEIRGIWVDGFADGFKTPEQIDQLLERVRRANLNAVFVQMRKSADSYYRSRYDIWATDNPQRFDALQNLIGKAHAASPRIQVHAWMNTFAVGKDRGNPRHVTLTRPDWLSVSDTGETHDGEAAKLDPGHPDAADYTARVYMDLLRHYDVDGIHLDFVRYGGPRWGYNPLSVERFNRRYGRNGQPAPKDPVWMQWRRDQVTALVRKIYLMAAAIKPRVQISAATITWQEGPRSLADWSANSAAMNRVFQDWRSWMKEGILDLNCLMSYYDERRRGSWYRQWLEFAKENQFGRYVAPAAGTWLNLIPDSLKQIAAIRKPSERGFRPKGVMLYSYAGTNKGTDGSEERYSDAFYKALSTRGPFSRNPPFAGPSSYPSLPWKENPKSGHIMGYAYGGPDLVPLDGQEIKVTAEGYSKSVRADGTGFFALTALKPGEYAVRLAEAPARKVRLTVRKGESATAALLRPGSASAEIRKLGDLSQIGPFSPVTLTEAVVVSGTDTMPGTLIVTDSEMKQLLRIQLAEPPPLAFQPGDVVAARGHWDPSAGEMLIDNARARLIAVRPAPDLARFAREVQGKVIAGADYRMETGDRDVVRVALGPRKDISIEDPAEKPEWPAPGSSIRLTALVSVPAGNADFQHVAYPVAADSVQVLRSASVNILVKLALWVGIGLASAFLTYALLRLRALRRVRRIPTPNS